ncbi:transposase [Streptococcus dysgalactiae subsp. equisimilis]|uniref:Transposase n=1 Tax=Streptococcus dysgalactiae subsp. equisimilis TaxID=119602 RepID=A0A9X8T7F7_STREQ|nr:transposase [Streptococcus dysgalactiae subsp. equisimilis]
MLTLVERQTRYALGVKLEDKQSQTINRAVTHLISQYPIASITADNGSEFSLLSTLEAVTFTLHIPILHMREEQTRTSMASSENMSLRNLT